MAQEVNLGAVSVNALKSIGFVLAIPVAIFIILKADLSKSWDTIIYLTLIGCVVGCVVFLGKLLRERNRSWAFLIPGSVIMAASIPVSYMAFAVGGEGLGLAIFITMIGWAVWYNCKGVGIIEGIIVTFIQIFLSVIIVFFALAKTSLRQGGR